MAPMNATWRLTKIGYICSKLSRSFAPEDTRREYNAALDALEKNGAVIFTIGSSQYPKRRWVEIQVSNNNQPKRVLYADEDGYHLIRHAHFNPKAVAAIQKRHKEERKK